jgi:hypothetical protein
MTIHGLDCLLDAVGKEIGPGDWHVVDQESPDNSPLSGHPAGLCSSDLSSLVRALVKPSDRDEGRCGPGAGPLASAG